MSYQESRVIAYLISALLGAGLYTFYIFQQIQQEGFDSTIISSFWGTTVLIVLGVQIVLSIIASILVTIIQAIVMQEEEPDLADERDRLIELKADRFSFIVFGIGFVVAMITLAMDLSPLIMFNLIVYSLFGAGITGYVTQLCLYRRGV
ncbi:MAG: hypothetical protein AAF702_18740 [Chloroflexota bacterium]